MSSGAGARAASVQPMGLRAAPCSPKGSQAHKPHERVTELPLLELGKGPACPAAAPETILAFGLLRPQYLSRC